MGERGKESPSPTWVGLIYSTEDPKDKKVAKGQFALILSCPRTPVLLVLRLSDSGQDLKSAPKSQASRLRQNCGRQIKT